MRTVTSFELAFSKPKILACWLCICRDSCLVDHSFCQAVAIEWTLLLVSAVTSAGVGVFVWCQHVVVVAADNSSHVWHTAVANFYRVSVEKLVIAMMLRKMLINQAKEFLGNVS